MEFNEQTRIFISMAAPASLILTPTLLGFVIYRIVRDELAGKSVDLLDPNLLFLIFFCVAGFIFGLFMCKRELGWFNGKKPD